MESMLDCHREFPVKISIVKIANYQCYLLFISILSIIFPLKTYIQKDGNCQNTILLWMLQSLQQIREFCIPMQKMHFTGVANSSDSVL
jgi:hypothetical protein